MTIEDAAHFDANERQRASVAPARTVQLLEGPVLPTLLRLTGPNIGEAAARIAFVVFDAIYVSWLGTDALAGITLVFPLFITMQMMSASGLGAGVAAAVGQAMGAGQRRDADALAGHGAMIAVTVALAFSLPILAFGPALYHALGATGASLQAAETYSTITFAGVIFVWLMNILANAVRGTGNMVVPAGAIIVSALLHLALSPLLILGWGPLPSLGIAGAAIAVVASYALGTIILGVYLLSGRGDICLRRSAFAPRRRHFTAILGVGGLAALNVLQIQIVLIISSALVAGFGAVTLAAFGAASRLELLQLPLTFAVGTAVITMIATNIGAGNAVRAQRIAWIGTAVSAGIGSAFGAVACFGATAWMGFFTTDPAVIAAGRDYLTVIAFVLPLMGTGLGLFFALLGAGKPVMPFLSGSVRLSLVAVLGWSALHLMGGGFPALTATFAAGIAAMSLCLMVAGWRAFRAL